MDKTEHICMNNREKVGEYRMTSNRPTMADVAKIADVSKATVSRVLKGNYPVSEETRKTVFDAVQKLNYIPSHQASALATGRSNIIGILITERFDLFFEDPTFRTIIRGVLSALSSSPLVPVMLQMTNSEEQRKAIHLFENGMIDGVIHVSPWGDTSLLDSMAQRGFPVVVCGQLAPKYQGRRISAVYTDDQIGANLIASYLKEKTVSRPCTILGDSSQPASAGRLSGFRDQFPILDSRSRVFLGDWTSETGKAGVKRFLADGVVFDSLLCGSDAIARGAIEELHKHGRTVPGDILVTGYDDAKIAAKDPGITTIAQPMTDQGIEAVAALTRLLDGGAQELIELPVKLVVRQSA
ncbi:LacI family DNA-binding transcriptional regulator [Trueperella pyogenes]|uniref:LacI family transcriptional regulator n=3 Tax=Trueperella pyogenes TaxID=1661 RepID=A0A3Q9GMZ4_9ACTO|nr:LacI family DNA-binding transcriptional regulator [Trueperella pyogenes]AZR07412.1 LacI family transcriptional regulator [Trueperella pyogenes]MBB3025133.1 DNA-binding LacI/PurR family transcriptional regulator [Trueperella pyogenes]MCI7690634.1 LacI family transcriptional regulator [Trueperella pyogenes]